MPRSMKSASSGSAFAFCINASTTCWKLGAFFLSSPAARRSISISCISSALPPRAILWATPSQCSSSRQYLNTHCVAGSVITGVSGVSTYTADRVELRSMSSSSRTLINLLLKSYSCFCTRIFSGYNALIKSSAASISERATPLFCVSCS